MFFNLLILFQEALSDQVFDFIVRITFDFHLFKFTILFTSFHNFIKIVFFVILLKLFFLFTVQVSMIMYVFLNSFQIFDRSNYEFHFIIALPFPPFLTGFFTTIIQLL